MSYPNERIKYALIGCGRIAPNHIAAVIANRGAIDFASACDVVPEHMGKLLCEFGLEDTGVKRYQDYREMLEKERPQLVAVATESGLHAQIALDAINAGCNVIVEKPLAMSLADADALVNAADMRGVKLCTCHQNRFNKSVQKIRGALEAGRFGRLYHAAAHIRWNRGEDYYTQAPWRGKWASDGGALMNQCIHNIDLLRWMMGDPVEVMAYTDRLSHPYIEAEDLGLAIVKFKNGSYGLIEGTTNVYPKNLEETLYIFGEKGTVKAGGKSVNLIEEWSFADSADGERNEVIRQFSENPPNVYGFGHTPLYADMVRAIKDGRPPYVPGEAGRAALELVLAIYKSAASGMPVALPMERCASTDFTGRFDAAIR
jgi:UDP-N-acetyl-2-amino-2-deoxyglucuronate dehydrogenase